MKKQKQKTKQKQTKEWTQIQSTFTGIPFPSGNVCTDMFLWYQYLFMQLYVVINPQRACMRGFVCLSVCHALILEIADN